METIRGKCAYVVAYVLCELWFQTLGVKGLTVCKTEWDTFLTGLLELARRYKIVVNIPQ